MIVDIDAPGDFLPGGGPTDKLGPVITVPSGVLSVSTTLVSVACYLCGWSFRESTGTAGAQAELVDGGDDNGSFIAALGLTQGFDPVATQTPADNTQQGANAALVATFGGAAGTLAWITSLRIEGLGATAATVVEATLVGVTGGTIQYPVNVPAGVAVPVAPVTDSFGARGLPASAVATAITLNVPAFGAGNTFAEAEIQGYIQTPAVAVDTRALDIPIYVQAGLRLRIIAGSVRGAVWIRR